MDTPTADVSAALAALRDAALAWLDSAGAAGIQAGDTRPQLAARLCVPFDEAIIAIERHADRHAGAACAQLIEGARADIDTVFTKLAAAARGRETGNAL